jgi:hypothetical protein
MRSMTLKPRFGAGPNTISFAAPVEDVVARRYALRSTAKLSGRSWRSGGVGSIPAHGTSAHVRRRAARLTVDRWTFNAAAISFWGARRRGFSDENDGDWIQLRARLVRGRFHRALASGSASTWAASSASSSRWAIDCR